MVDRELHSECATDLATRMHYEIDSKKEDDEFHQVYRQFKMWYGLDPDNPKEHLDKYTIMRLQGLRNGEFFSKGKNTKYRKAGYSTDVIYKTMVFVSLNVERALQGKIRDQNRTSQTNYIIAIIMNNIHFINGRVKANERAKRSLENVEVNMETEDKTVYVSKHEKSELQKAFEKIDNQDNNEDDFSDIL